MKINTINHKKSKFKIFIIIVIMLTVSSLISHILRPDATYNKASKLLLRLQQNGVKDIFSNKIKEVFNKNDISDIYLIQKEFRNITHHSSNLKRGTSTYMVIIDNKEREFFVTWEKPLDSDDLTLLSIDEIKNRKDKENIYIKE